MEFLGESEERIDCSRAISRKKSINLLIVYDIIEVIKKTIFSAHMIKQKEQIVKVHGRVHIFLKHQQRQLVVVIIVVVVEVEIGTTCSASVHIAGVVRCTEEEDRIGQSGLSSVLRRSTPEGPGFKARLASLRPKAKLYSGSDDSPSVEDKRPIKGDPIVSTKRYYAYARRREATLRTTQASLSVSDLFTRWSSTSLVHTSLEQRPPQQSHV
ncbi:hypothetical protein V1478_001455 [Vespula squamosa]|uniref:Uncharacterized protein n=1 Tax=Vespula squamosa TaxID=30214 RepID=A0ABD2C1L1_VESSQ